MLKRAIFAGCLILLTAGSVWSAVDTFQLPDDLLKLMPADPAVILAVTSVNDLDRQWRAIEHMLDDGTGDGERTDLIALLSERIPHFDEYGDLDRPLAIVVGLPNPMSGQEPDIVFIVPIRESFTDREGLGNERVDIVFGGDYLSISSADSSTSGYSPAAEIPDLAQNLSPGFASARIDLELILATFRPVVEMGLATMQIGLAEPDTSETGEINQYAGLEAEHVAAIGDLSRSIMDSSRRLDLALSVEGENLTLHSEFSVFRGSPLDPDPQPSFEDALQLTRLLPAGGNIIQTMAMDQTRQFEVFKDLYTTTMAKEIAKMPPEQGAAYGAWLESYLASVDLFANPLAVSLKMSAESISANLVMECVDAPANIERIAGLFEGLSAADIGIRLKKMPTGKVAGVEVRSWIVEYDTEKLVELNSQPASPQLSGAGRLQGEQMVAFLRKVTPNVNMAARGDYLILSADSDPANLAHMIQMAGQRRGAANPEIAAVAAKTGPDCQQVVVGDLMSILAWVTEWMEEIEEKEFATIEGNPIPFTGSFTIGEVDYGFDWTMDMPAVQQFIKAMMELEAFDDSHEDHADDVEIDDQEAEETD